MSTQVGTSRLRLTLPARPEYLMFTRLALTGLSTAVEIEEEALADLKLAVSEACSYAIRSCTTEEAELEVSYELSETEIGVVVQLQDCAGPAGEPAAATPDEDDLGLAVMNAVVEDVDIVAGHDGRIERLSFRKPL
jgi:anti-sigma regulatory factor (Ser/Thr protein kinase)